MADKYTVINNFVKSYEAHANDCFENKIQVDPDIANHKHAYLLGTTLGGMTGLLYNLNLTEEQVEVLNSYYSK